jgi:formiminotetrahydrofolate cyclodeaminase
MTEYLDLPVRDLLDAVAAESPAPAAGSVAALTAALAAGLTAMAAGLSTRQLPEAASVAARARGLQERAAPLAQEDSTAYAGVLAAQALPADDPERSEAVARALARASEAPLEVVAIGAELTTLAAEVARRGNPRLRGDAVTAGLLAEAAARSAVALVEINLRDSEHPMLVRARALAASLTPPHLPGPASRRNRTEAGGA